MKINKLIVSMYAVLTMLGQGLVAQDGKNMSLLGNYGRGEGDSKAVFAAGSLVFYGLGNKVQIASFSNAASPVKVGSVIVSDVVEGLVRTSINSTQYIVACGGSKMWIINVQVPTAPFLVSTVEVVSGSTCEGIATSGTYAYIAAGRGGLKIYDITAPALPVFVSEVTTLDYCESVIVSQPYVFIAANTTTDYSGKSYVYDISTPKTPVFKSKMLGYGGYHQYMNVRSGYAYICDYNSGGGLQVINVTDVTNPVNVTTIPLGHGTGGITFDGNYAYVAVADSGLAIFNVSNPALPVLTGKIKTPGLAKAVYYGAITISGIPTGHIYVSNAGSSAGMSAINVSVPATPVTSSFLAAFAAPTGIAYTPFYTNGKVYVAYGSAGLRIIDVTNTASPTLLGTAVLGGDSRSVVVSGNYAFVAARDSGVFVVDVTNSASPVKIKTFKTRRAYDIAINGTKVYVAANDSGLAVIDITNPASASIIAYTGSSTSAYNVAVNGNVAGISNYDQIAFFDITNPSAPVKKGLTGLAKTGHEGLAIAGNNAYVTDGDSMKIFNITNLSAPTLTSRIFTGGYGYAASVVGNYCYVASEVTGVRAINITNPSVPVEDGYYDGVPQSRGLMANGKYVYVAEKADGITIYSNDLPILSVNKNALLPEAMTLHQNYPNPFNPTTNIAIELKEKAFVSVDVFNSLGQRVAVLVNKQMSAGSYNIPFNGSSLSAGVYLYRLQANGVTITKKMVLVK
jgi:hypothetical protein